MNIKTEMTLKGKRHTERQREREIKNKKWKKKLLRIITNKGTKCQL